ncbi:MAG TPA: hypothetical protein VFF12_17890 [Myxococcaceae bacterium]|nr:hypothetical protein [Myxococcaceae bacterium]
MENNRSGRVRAIVAGGLAAALLDAMDALVAYKLAYGMSPLVIYQFVASGLLGKAAYSGGATAALLGLGVHFLVAFSAATVFVLASERLPALRRGAVGWGLAFGVAVFAVMSFVVIPLSRIGASVPPLLLVVNGVLGHALLVGLPIALAARHFLGGPAPFGMARAIA